MKNLTDVKERISYYIENKNIKPTNFYRETGVSYGILTQKTKMSEENIVRILIKYSEISPAWLLLGEGEMIRGKEVEFCPVDNEFMLRRYEALAIENGELKNEIKHLKKDLEDLKNNTRPNVGANPYSEHEKKLNIAADPSPKFNPDSKKRTK